MKRSITNLESKKVVINILRAFKRYRFNPFRCIRFIYYNLFCENIDIDLADSLFLVWDSVDLDLKKGSKIKSQRNLYIRKEIWT